MLEEPVGGGNFFVGSDEQYDKETPKEIWG